MAMKSVLIVEDETDLIELYTTLLVRKGYLVEKAGDGLQALTFLAQRTFDLVLLDIMLPELDGLQVLQKLAEDRTAYPQPFEQIMMLTNLAQDKVVEQAIGFGVRGYLVKSDYDPQQFLDAIEGAFS